MTSPISIHVLALLALALIMAYCAGAFASGMWAALFLILSGIFASVATFMEASTAYSEGLADAKENTE